MTSIGAVTGSTGTTAEVALAAGKAIGAEWAGASGLGKGPVSEALEVEDPIPGQYTLEVSSPGFDRVLRKPEHFERFLGERVFVELKLPLNGRRRFAGKLVTAGAQSILVEVDGQEYDLPMDRIHKAKLKPE